MLIVSLSFISGAMNPAPPYCQNQGHQYWVINGSALCLFDDGNSCDLRDFYDGTCGQEYVKEFPCVELGRPVFSNFEECCKGKSHLSSFMVGQPICKTYSQIFTDNLKHNPFYWLVELIILFLLIFAIYKVKKKIKNAKKNN